MGFINNLLALATHAAAGAYTCNAPEISNRTTVAVMVTGLYRTAGSTLQYIRRQYPPNDFAMFVVTDGIADPGGRRAKHVCEALAPTMMQDLPTHDSSQHAGITLCARLITAHEAKWRRQFDWIARQRIDTLGCTRQRGPPSRRKFGIRPSSSHT